VYIDFLCIYCVYELIKLIKYSKILIHILFIILYLYIKFQHQIPNNKGAVKKIKFLTDPPSKICQKFLFFLHINYNKFNLKIL
jgi:hypothetical protein